MNKQTRSSKPARTLPGRANLEHLRNEAKTLLKSMRRENPDTQLAAAQLNVARSYGFESWRKLKAYVDTLRDHGDRLIQAVQAGDVETMRSILERNPALANATTDAEQRVRPSDARAMRLIHLAVAADQMQAAQLLIECGADLNVRNADGRLPLHDCFELGRDELARALLTAGATADVCAAAGYGMHDRLRDLLQEDAARANDLQTGMAPLAWSVYGNQPESARILIEHGAILDRPPHGATIWGAASHVANTSVTSILLSHGADPNCLDGDGDTPLHNAIQSRIVRDPSQFVELLLSFGADRTIRNKQGRTALDEARRQTGSVAETYFPARPTGAKNLEKTIELLA